MGTFVLTNVMVKENLPQLSELGGTHYEAVDSAGSLCSVAPLGWVPSPPPSSQNMAVGTMYWKDDQGVTHTLTITCGTVPTAAHS
jgi:hypothetical protein